MFWRKILGPVLLVVVAWSWSWLTTVGGAGMMRDVRLTGGHVTRSCLSRGLRWAQI